MNSGHPYLTACNQDTGAHSARLAAIIRRYRAQHGDPSASEAGLHVGPLSFARVVDHWAPEYSHRLDVIKVDGLPIRRQPFPGAITLASDRVCSYSTGSRISHTASPMAS